MTFTHLFYIISLGNYSSWTLFQQEGYLDFFMTYLFKILILSKIELTSNTSISIACCDSTLTCPKNWNLSFTGCRCVPAVTNTRSSSTWALPLKSPWDFFWAEAQYWITTLECTVRDSPMGIPLLKTSLAAPTLSNGFVSLPLPTGLLRCARQGRLSKTQACLTSS